MGADQSTKALRFGEPSEGSLVHGAWGSRVLSCYELLHQRFRLPASSARKDMLCFSLGILW